MSEPKTPDLAPGPKTEQGKASVPDQRRETRCENESTRGDQRTEENKKSSGTSRKSAKKEDLPAVELQT
jgi:hypothetical protein